MKVRNVGSNMTEVETNDTTILVSYSTPVACLKGGKFYRTEKKWSKTTSRHINKWLSGAHAETQPQEFFDNLV